MKLYTAKMEASSARKIVVDDMILTKEIPTAAGSKMLDGYVSLFEAEALTKLAGTGYVLGGKAAVGEFAIDLVGETAYTGALVDGGVLKNASAEIIKAGDAVAAIGMDVNGAPRRAAAQNGLINVKPTYGTVSRFGTVPVACSGEIVSVTAKTVADCRDILDVIAGHDDKDGTSLADELCAKLKKGADCKPVKRVAHLKSMTKGIDADVAAKMDAFVKLLEKNGVEVCEVEDDVIAASRVAWNILMSAELCNNVSRYDGVKYGYRAQSFTNLDELYTNSRTEAFGKLLKTAILFGSETLSTDNYMKVYDKALRTRRVIVEAFAKMLEGFDAVLMPACSALSYTEEQVEANEYMAFEENFYTAPASITGLPAVVVGGVQLVGPAFSEQALLGVAEF